MTVSGIDTLAVAKDLKAAGFTDEQAEAVSRVVRQSQDIDLSNLATKADLAVFATKADLATTKADLQAAIAGTKADLATTKADLQAAIAETRADLATTKAGLQAALAETKADILKWMVSTIGVQTVVILGAVATLLRMLH